MLIRSIAVKNVMGTDESFVEFPVAGMVLVTGPNGAGKSTIFESPGTCAWNKSLRGAAAWRTGAAGMIVVETDEVTITRTRTKGGKLKLTWEKHDGTAQENWESNTDAQAALDSMIGGFDLWRRTHVFSSADAAHFTTATDSKRKALLENILMLDQFDIGLKMCREDLKDLRKKIDRLERSLETGDVAMVGLTKRLDDAEATIARLADYEDERIAEPPSATLLKTRETETAAIVSSCEADIRELGGKLRKLRDRVAVETASNASLTRQITAMAATGLCPTCSQDVTEVVAQLRAQIESAQEAARKVGELIAGEVDDLEADANEVTEERDAMQKALHDVQSQLTHIDQLVANAATVKRANSRAQDELQAARTIQGDVAHETKVVSDRMRVYRKALPDLVAQEKVLVAAEIVLGLKGVRAHVLGEALSGIEVVANRWLADIAGAGLQLSLKPYKETGSGVSDSISLEIIGAGGGLGYKASSGGERRRIDVAMVMALAEIAQAARGAKDGGTVFFDEVFDALDADGIDAVARVLVDLSMERCVVVISHNAALAARLEPTLHLKVNGGIITTA